MIRLTIVALTLVASTSQAVTIASDTFEVGDAVNYFVVFGNLPIVGPTPPLASNSLAFNGVGGQAPFYYDQIQYPGSDARVRVSFDLLTANLVGSPDNFALILDTPIVGKITFENTGEIVAANPSRRTTHPLTTIGTFSDGQLMHIATVLSIPENTWQIFINDTLVYTAVPDATRLDDVRFSHGVFSTAVPENFQATTYLDNVLIETISAVVPIPAAVWLLGSALGVLGWVRRKSIS